MQPIDFTSISTDSLLLPLLQQKDVRMDVLRLDKIHPVISGNKLFKLGCYLQKAKQSGKTHIITFGGAWSNHIAATAAACRMEGIFCTGYIRGEEPSIKSATLVTAKEMGMELHFLSREAYRLQKRVTLTSDPDTLIIPEGGYGKNGAEGAASILNYCSKEKYTHIICAAGTGTMTAGLASGITPQQQLISISVLKNNLQIATDIAELTGDLFPAPVLIHDFHFGGYAKHTEELITFMNTFYTSTRIPSDFVYTGKLFYAAQHLVQQNYFRPGSSILVIHSGGLQGNASLNKGTLIF
jgi:1-aminocyclopropane-1-carboxylate deaminase